MFDFYEDYSDEEEPSLKRPRQEEFRLKSVETAIDEEYREQRASRTSGVNYDEIIAKRELIKKFVGPISPFFEDKNNRTRSGGMEDFMRDRVKKTFKMKYAARGEVELSNDEETWLSTNYLLVVRIVYRTFWRFGIHDDLGFPRTFFQICADEDYKILNDKFQARIAAMAPAPDGLLVPQTGKTAREEDVMIAARDAAIAEGVDETTANRLLGEVPVGLLENAFSRLEVPPQDRILRDDPIPMNVVVDQEDIPMEVEEQQIPLEEDQNRPIADDTMEEAERPVRPLLKRKPLKSCLKKQPGRHYSDSDVYTMTDDERLTYAAEYQKLPKKAVKFSDVPPECLLVCVDHVKALIEEQKKQFGLQAIIAYPRQFTEFYVGERYTTAMEVSYDTYRRFFAPVRLTTASTRDSERPEVKITNKEPSQYSSLNTAEVLIPAHAQLRSRRALPVTRQIRFLSCHLHMLHCYGSFWQPEWNGHGFYNKVFGPMIISDSLLEDANPSFLLNTGLFCFPSPFDAFTVLAFLDGITAEQFSGVRDICLVWGIDNILRGQKAIYAVSRLLTLYDLIRAKMNAKMEKFKSEGYHRLTMPKFWISTIPETGQLLNIREFNRMITIFTNMSDTGLIDWHRSLLSKNIVVDLKNVGAQLECLYDELEKHVGVTRYRSQEEIKELVRKGARCDNRVEWKADFVRKEMEIRQAQQSEGQDDDMDVKPDRHALDKMIRKNQVPE